MTCTKYKEWLMGYLDNELDDAQKLELRRHLDGCAECRRDLEDFRKLVAITGDVQVRLPEDRLWADYWDRLYNRLERQTAWILFSVAAVVLLVSGGWMLIEAIVEDHGLPLVVKIAMLATLVGGAILLVSIARERLFFWKHDRYRDVRR